jgi:hypothetical protein
MAATFCRATSCRGTRKKRLDWKTVFFLNPRRRLRKPGLPDGIFSNQKSKFGQISEGLVMEDVGMFSVHLVYFSAICHILWPFGIFLVNWYIFSHFGIL